MDKRYGWIILSWARGRSLNIQKACHFPKIVWCWPFSQFVRKLLHDLCGLSVILQQRLHKRRQLTHLLHLQRQKHDEYLKNRKKKRNMVTANTTPNRFDEFRVTAQHIGKKTRQVRWYVLPLNTCVFWCWRTCELPTTCISKTCNSETVGQCNFTWFSCSLRSFLCDLPLFSQFSATVLMHHYRL